MGRKPKPEPDDGAKSERFIDAARKAETDESEEGAERAFKKTIKPKRKERD